MSLNMPEPPPRPGAARASWELVIADVLSRPQGNENLEVRDLVVSDMRERDVHGAAKYGVRHQHDNGRDHLVDAYQEALDLALYLRAALERQHDGIIAALYSEAITIVVWLRAELRRRGR